MFTTPARHSRPVPLDRVTLDDTFWGPRQETNRRVTLPIEYTQCKNTNRIDAWRLDWKPGDPDMPHHFWDSDIAKWLEAVGYTLARVDDPELERVADEVIALIAAAQQDDGYLNIHFTVAEPENRWANLRDMHELYCAGHLMEAAVAYHQGTGKRTLLDVLCRYADYIASVFGPGESQKRGYPGHEEIELGLIKLYHATDETRYLDLARFFVDERGRQPHYFDLEAAARGEAPGGYRFSTYDYCQAHRPVREQGTAEGHAVRAMYLYAGMADVAAATDDPDLLAACERLWDNVTSRRMYLTGGIGSTAHGERFTYDYDLPNDTAYAETCAAIGLVFFAHRMVGLTGETQYADVMERALYNGVLSGISLDGERFFYGNPLEIDPVAHEKKTDVFHKPAVSPERQEWFGCACCPPNIARLLASLSGYVYGEGVDGIDVYLYAAGRATLQVGDATVTLTQETRYPWDGEVQLTLGAEAPAAFALRLRIPDWCEGASASVNGKAIKAAPGRDGFLAVERAWADGDVVALSLPMTARFMQAHPAVRADAGKVAIQRGPLVYCLEEIDNGANLPDVAISPDVALRAAFDETLLGGMVVIEAAATRSDPTGWEGALYRPLRAARLPITVRAIPYYAWGNRGGGEMIVWMNQA